MSYPQGGGPDQWNSGSAPPFGGGSSQPYGAHPPPPGGYPHPQGGGAPYPPYGAPPAGVPGAPPPYVDPFGQQHPAHGQASPAYGGGPSHSGGYGPPPSAYGEGGYAAPPPPAYGGAPAGYPPAGGYPQPGGAPGGYPPPGGAPGGYPPHTYPHEQVGLGGAAGGDAQRFLGHGQSHHVSGHAPSVSALGRPIAAGSHIFNTLQSFKVQEKVASLSGDSFDVKDAVTGARRYAVHGATLTMRQRKRLVGAAGEPLLGMSQERLSLRGRMTITDSTGRPAVTLRKRGFVSGMGNSTVLAWWGSDPDASAPFLEAKGDVFRKSYTLTEIGSGRPVGNVKRHIMGMKNFLTDRDNFTLTVQPGYDCAFLVMLVVALDEMYTDDN